jgi:hypothetical protein
MGQLYSYFSPRRMLCSDYLDDTDFSIQITIHTLGKNPDYMPLVDYLQATNPALSYTYCKSVYLLYSNAIKYPMLRSNISGEIISSVSADVTRYCILNNICDPYNVEVDIYVEPHYVARNKLVHLMKSHMYHGRLHGLAELSEQKIKEQFD